VRVVAGSAGGLALAVPKTDLRPTMDRVRGAVFSSLGELTIGAQVLDLFAGTGALGIEALSRGAASAVFVENDRRAVSAIEKNLALTRMTGAIHTLDVFSYLDRLAAPESFDIIFADPPYAKAAGERDFGSELLANASLRRALKADGLLILEHLPNVALPLSSGWQTIRDKRYGATAVAFLKPSFA
jgi:16S rRNA (guanine966-N2)-methyltransferase